MFSIIPGLEEYDDSDCKEERDDVLSHDSESCSRVPDSVVNVDSVPPKGISTTMWEKFKNLQQRREEAAKEKIHNYKRQRRKPRRRKAKRGDTDAKRKHNADDSDDDDDDGGGDVKRKTEHWQNLKQYVGVFDRFKGTDQGSLAAKSGLEKEIDEAIVEGDIDTAEKLNERFVQRDLGEKLSEAADARDFAARKKTEEDQKKAKKKKDKPVWTFEAKQRWEMKAAM